MFTHALFLGFVQFILFPVTFQQDTLPPKAIHPARKKVLEDALSWMTFRKDGKLASDQDLEPIFEGLRVKYHNSKHFKTLIVLFRDGILPRLTLKENEACDPAYTLEYKDPFNNSVTYGQLQKFIFKYYDNKNKNRNQFCDYRQGLVCNPQTKKCECPQGSKMGPISEGSSVQRCQLEENEVCALIDLDHDPNSEYKALKKVLPEMVFNLEKPLSCKLGTQCRFTGNSPSYPSCFNNNKGGQWSKGRWNMDLGEKCAIDLYAGIGPCSTSAIGNLGGYTCFNFGALKPAVPTHVGICAHDLGSYGITSGYSTNSGLRYNPLFIGLVSPATTPLRGRTLRNYYQKYLDNVYQPFVHHGDYSAQSHGAGEPCNVAKTEEWLDHWKFFLSLEGTPPPSQDHVATEAELQDRLQKVVDMTDNLKKKACRVFSIYGHSLSLQKALRCISGSADADGNDGKCELVPEAEDVTLAWAYQFEKYRKYVSDVFKEVDKEYYRSSLIAQFEIECDPKLGRPPGSEGAPKTDPGDNVVLEGGYCPPDRGCYKNYGDYLNIYDNDCNWKDSRGEQSLFRDCQWMAKERTYGKCEERILDEKIEEELKKIPENFKGVGGRGDLCDFNFEQRIRKSIRYGDGIGDENKYDFLWKLQNNENALHNVPGLCDRSKLLECSQKTGTCECLPDTTPKKVTFEGVDYMSDYCYVTRGYCSIKYFENKLYKKDMCSKKEIDEIEKHYKGKENNCLGANWCVYMMEQNNNYVCTLQNTGNTGFMPKPGGDGNGGGSPPKCQGQYCDYEDAGKRKNQLNESLKMMMIIVILITM